MEVNHSSNSELSYFLILPIDLFPYLSEFLFRYEFHLFLNTTKQLHDIKHHSLYLDLNRFYSTKYYRYPYFRRQVNNLVFNPGRQIGLRYFLNEIVHNLEVVNNIDQINLYRCPRVTNLYALGRYRVYRFYFSFDSLSK